MHKEGTECKFKPKKSIGEIEKFRNSKAWRKKRNEILERDLYCCVCCRNKVYDLGKREFNTENIEVHHIIPLRVNFNLRLDNSNLISLCREHHELAEAGIIKPSELQMLINYK